MPFNRSQTATLTNTQTSPIDQVMEADYTGIYCFCGVILFLGLLGYVVIYKISEKWRVDNYKIRQLAVNKTCEQNIMLLRKLDKVLDALHKEIELDAQ